MKRFLFIAIFSVLLAGCAKEGTPVNVSQYGKDSFEVELLFEKDGVRVYRFEDYGHHRYFTVGNGSFQPQTQSKTVSNGRATTTQMWSDGASSN